MTIDDQGGGGANQGLPLLWAQRAHWSMYRLAPPAQRWRNNVRAAVRVPDGLSVEVVRECVNELVASHDVLRMSCQLAASGDIELVTHPARDVEFEFCDVTGKADPTQCVKEFFTDLLERGFVLEAEPMLRVGLVVEDSAPRWVALVLYHLATDAYGAMALQRGLAVLLDNARLGRSAPRPLVRQPAQEAGYESSEAGRRENRQALEYWESMTADFPATTVPLYPASPVSQQPMQASFASSAGPAARLVAKRWRVPESVAILAVFGAVLNRLTGNRRTAVRVSSANRFRPESLTYTGCLAQLVPIVLDPPPTSMPAAAQYTKKALRPIYRHGRFDPDAAWGILMKNQYRNGVNIESMVSYNYVDRSSEDQRYARRAEEAAGIVGPGGDIVFSRPEPEFFDYVGLLVRRSADRLSLTVRYHAALLPDALARDLLVGLDRVLTVAEEAADGTSVSDLLDRAGIAACASGGRWMTRDGCRVSLDAVEALVGSCPSVTSCRASTTTSDEILCYVRGHSIDLHRLRCHVVARLKDWPAAVVPDRFVATDGVADPMDDEDAWARLPVVETGTGLERPGVVPDTPESAALEAALKTTNPGLSWAGAGSYLAAGGRVGRIDAFLDALRGLGYAGLEYADLYGCTESGELIARLRPVRSCADQG